MSRATEGFSATTADGLAEEPVKLFYCRGRERNRAARFPALDQFLGGV